MSNGMRGMLGAYARFGKEAQGTTVKEVLQNANADFNIGMESVYTKDGKVIPNQFRTFREDTDETFGVVKGTYKVMQNERLLNISDDLVKRGVVDWDRIGLVDNGRKIVASFKMPDGFSIGGMDSVDQYIMLQNTNDGSGGIRILPSNVRVECGNQFTYMQNLLNKMGVDKNALTIRHSSRQEDRIAQLVEALKIVDHLNQTFMETATELINVEMSQDERINFYIDTLGLKQSEDMMKGGKDYDANNPYGLGTRGQNTLTTLLDLETSDTNTLNGMENSAWAAFNVATEYIDHAWSHSKDGKSSDSKVESAIVGAGARMKSNAWETITEMYC